MKEVLSLFMFGIGALLFLGFLTAVKPTAVTAASDPGEQSQCSTKAPSLLACPSLMFAKAFWPYVARQN